MSYGRRMVAFFCSQRKARTEAVSRSSLLRFRSKIDLGRLPSCLRCPQLIAVAGLVRVYLVTLDHATKGFSVDAQNPGCRLLVSACVREDARYITSFYFGQQRPFFRQTIV